MVFIYGVCDGNATAAAAEYQRRYPNRRTPNPKTFSGTFNTLRQSGSLPSVNIQYERDHERNVREEENILDIVHGSPGTSTRRVARRLGCSHSRVWRTLNENEMYPYHTQTVQHLHPGDLIRRVEFCNWLQGNGREFYRLIMFTDESQFTRDGINNLHNSHEWAVGNPHATVETNFQLRFHVNVWCGVLHDQLIGPFILPGNLTGAMYLHFLQNELPLLLEDVSLETRGRMYFQHDGAPAHFSRAVRDHLNQYFPERWIGRGSPHQWPARSPDLTPIDYCIWCTR